MSKVRLVSTRDGPGSSPAIYEMGCDNGMGAGRDIGRRGRNFLAAMDERLRKTSVGREEFATAMLWLKISIPIGLLMVAGRFAIAQTRNPNSSSASETLPAAPSAVYIAEGLLRTANAPYHNTAPATADYSVTMHLSDFRPPPCCFRCLAETSNYRSFMMPWRILLKLKLYVCPSCLRTIYLRKCLAGVFGAVVGASIGYGVSNWASLAIDQELEIVFNCGLFLAVYSTLSVIAFTSPLSVRNFSSDRNVGKLVFKDPQYLVKYLANERNADSTSL